VVLRPIITDYDYDYDYRIRILYRILYLELRQRPMRREHARPQPPAGSRRCGGGAEEPAPVPVLECRSG
jgi:hypothetical protein